MFRITGDGLDYQVHESGKRFTANDHIEEYILPVQTTENQPLTRIWMTHTPEGSVLAVSMSHALVDGFSYFHFLSSWARSSRGERILSPHIPRDIFSNFIAPYEQEITHTTLYENCGLFSGKRRSGGESRTLVTERDFIKHDTIKGHIVDVQQEHSLTVSENDVITALLWKKYIPRWTGQAGDQKVYVTCPYDFRRVLAGFPKNYFGCALCFATAETTRENLINASTGDVALLIKKSVSAIKDEYIQRSLSILDRYRRQNGAGEMERIHLRHPDNGMIVTNISRLPLRDLNFGTGRPDDYLAFAEIEQSAAIVPAANGVETFVAHP